MTDYRLGASVPVIIDNPRDIDGEIISAPALALTVKKPDTTIDGPFTPTYDSFLDKYIYAYTPGALGQYIWRAVETGTGQGAAEGSFYIYPAYSKDTDAWAPTLADVAAMVPTRTIDSSNVQQNTFTANTTPTNTQVTGYITRIVAEVAGVVGEIPSTAFDQAKHTATLGVAWLIERSYPPTADVQNVANDFVNDYRQSLKTLAASIRGAEVGARTVSMSLDSYTWPEV